MRDFPHRFHRIIFGSLKNIYNSGVREIDPPTIDCFLAQYKEQYKIFEQNKGLNYLEEALDISNFESFDYHVKRIKKFTILRDLNEAGFNVKEIYDEDNEKKVKEFDDLELDDIINYYNKKLIEIEKNIVNVEAGSHISEGVNELIEELEESPIMGYDSGINALNYYLFGLRKKYYLISAGSGYGKTRIQAYCALMVGYHQKIPCLFISTELPKDEIQTMILAYIANISERKILTNKLTSEERIRRNEAAEKLKDSNIHIVYIPDFNLEKIEHTIKRFILSKKVEYIFFDYIKESISMIEGINQRVGKIDGWKALNLFSERLKMLNEKYQVGIMSATQINKEGNTAGSAAIPNAVDVWMKLRPTTKDEREKHELDFNVFNEDEEVIVIDVLKNRRGLKDFQIFMRTNLGKLYYQEIAVVKNDNPIKVPKVKFDYAKEEEGDLF